MFNFFKKCFFDKNVSRTIINKTLSQDDKKFLSSKYRHEFVISWKWAFYHLHSSYGEFLHIFPVKKSLEDLRDNYSDFWNSKDYREVISFIESLFEKCKEVGRKLYIEHKIKNERHQAFLNDPMRHC